MNRKSKLSKIIDLKMSQKIKSNQYKNEVFLDKDLRFTNSFFKLMAEIFLELIKNAKEKNERGIK